MELKEGLLQSLPEGCAGIKSAIGDYAAALPCRLFCPCPAFGLQSHSVPGSGSNFVSVLSSILRESRGLLAALYRLSLSAALEEDGQSGTVDYTAVHRTATAFVLSAESESSIAAARASMTLHAEALHRLIQTSLRRAASDIADADQRSRAEKVLLYFNVLY